MFNLALNEFKEFHIMHMLHFFNEVEGWKEEFAQADKHQFALKPDDSVSFAQPPGSTICWER